MRLHPFLSFSGNAEAAMRFYQSVLGGEIEIMRYGDMPDASDLPPGVADKAAHVQLDTGGVLLQGSDMVLGKPAAPYGGFEIQITLDDPEEGRALFDKLAGCGAVDTPYEPTFWAKGFGICRDRFGVPWMVNVM